jgi:simple sugar transport system ATP-binding protein
MADPTSAAPVIRLSEITRRFGPVLANDRVSLDLHAGEVHALVGENGAGKSTLMKVLYGLHPPQSGTIEVDGKPVRIGSPGDAMRLGLGMVHQHFLLVDTLTVAENVVLGREPGSVAGRTAGALAAFAPARAEREVAELAERHRLPIRPGVRVADLSVGEQQRVEILKALHRGARVLILDEPTAVLTPQEVDELFVILRELRQGGTTIVLITHKLAEVKALADRVTVMRAGRVVGSGRASELSTERMAELMVGHVPAPLAQRAARAPGEPVLEARGVQVHDARGLPAVRGLSLVVRAGEIVGVAGVEGNGQHELVECLAGLRPARAGRVLVAGHDVTGRGARAHTDAGLAHIPADRLRRGLVGEMTSAENLFLGRQREPAPPAPGFWLGGPSLALRAIPTLAEFDVRPPDPNMRAGRLSGGNQQKLVAARELGRQARALIAAHPTRGVDLGSVDALHRRVLAARDAGLGVLLVSSELSEILALSDRIVVLTGGRIVHETTPASTDERTLGLWMTGRATLVDSPTVPAPAPRSGPPWNAGDEAPRA